MSCLKPHSREERCQVTAPQLLRTWSGTQGLAPGPVLSLYPCPAALVLSLCLVLTTVPTEASGPPW